MPTDPLTGIRTQWTRCWTILDGWRDALDSRWGFIKHLDRNPLQMAVLYFGVAVVGILCVNWSYDQYGDYWLLTWGEHGPTSESCFILIVAIVSYWIRYVQFPRNSELPTRSWIGLCILLLFFSVTEIWYLGKILTSETYRYGLGFYTWYFIGWILPLLLYSTLGFEVIFAVACRYLPKRLEDEFKNENVPLQKHYERLHSLAERLAGDTTKLTWSMGTVTFFIMAYFGRFYLGVTDAWVYVAVLLVVSIALFPWLSCSSLAKNMLEEAAEACTKKIHETKSELIKASAEHHELAPITHRLDVLMIKQETLDHLLNDFNVTSWLQMRYKDVLPVSALNLLAPYIGIASANGMLSGMTDLIVNQLQR